MDDRVAMDPGERADILFAQLDMLLQAGRLDAARDLAAQIREHVRSSRSAVTVPGAARDGVRVQVLEPLILLLREQRALARDVAAAAAAAGQDGAGQAAETGALGAALDRGIEQLSFALKALGQPMDEMANQRLRAMAGKAVGRLRHAVGTGRARPVIEAIAAVRSDVQGLTRDQLAESGVDERLAGLLALLDPGGRRAQAEELADRQAALLLRAVVPRGPEGERALPSRMAAARASMEQTSASLLRRDLQGAAASSRAAGRSLAEAARQVDRALGTADGGSRALAGFLGPFVVGTRPEWDLPSAVGLRLHEELGRLAPAERRDLEPLVRRLMAPYDPSVRVEFRQQSAETTDASQRADIFVPCDASAPGVRWIVRLGFSEQASGEVVPAPTIPTRELTTLGGGASVLFSSTLQECSLMVLRLHDRGPGPHLGYLDGGDAALREAVERRLAEVFVTREPVPSPVRDEVLGWLDDVDGAVDSPVPEEILRQLDIPWYDPSDLVDLVRPVHEALTFEFLDGGEEDSDFPGIAWLDEHRRAFFRVHLGPDGRSPRIALASSLARFLAWVGKRSEKQPDQPTFSNMMAAIQLHLGLKLALYDDPDVRPKVVHQAARALERSYLESRGLPGTCVFDLLAGLSLDKAAALAAGEAQTPWDRWSRRAESLFDARAGEELLRGGRLPPSVVYGPLRGTLAKALYEEGHLAAARSATEFGALREAAVLFANLLVEPGSGGGVLIVGDSKIGKSSITARLVAGAGRDAEPWGFGASDRILVFLPPRGEGAGGVDRAVATASPAHRRFGQWSTDLWYRDARKREVKPRDSVVIRSAVPLQTLVYVHRDGGELRSGGLLPQTIADLVVDFQARFGFGGNRRFWRSLLASVSLQDVALRRRGSDTFHEAAEAIRAHARVAEEQRGLGTPRIRTLEADRAWFGLASERRRFRITRVGLDGLDLDYLIAPDGSATVRPSQIGREVQALRRGSFALEDMGSLVALEPARIEELFEIPHYRVSASRWMPLMPEYFRSTMSGPCFFVPELPESVVQAVLHLMARSDPALWRGFLGEPGAKDK